MRYWISPTSKREQTRFWPRRWGWVTSKESKFRCVVLELPIKWIQIISMEREGRLGKCGVHRFSTDVILHTFIFAFSVGLDRTLVKSLDTSISIILLYLVLRWLRSENDTATSKSMSNPLRSFIELDALICSCVFLLQSTDSPRSVRTLNHSPTLC